jgi:hypothetical protein
MSSGIYKGGVQDRMRHGEGTLTETNGRVYTGGWKCNTRHGQGKMVYHYNNKHGPGQIFYPDDYRYEGGWRNDKMCGRGKFTACNNTYEGELKENYMHGRGKLTVLNEYVYEGTWRKGKRHGKGKMTFAGGDVYVGMFSDRVDDLPDDRVAFALRDFWCGQRCGRGKLTQANGDVFDGLWKEDYLNGYGKYALVNGEVYEGMMNDDVAHGQGKMTYSCGEVYDGWWCKGSKHGRGVQTVDGCVYTGGFVDGHREGLGTMVDGCDVYKGTWLKGELWNGERTEKRDDKAIQQEEHERLLERESEQLRVKKMVRAKKVVASVNTKGLKPPCAVTQLEVVQIEHKSPKRKIQNTSAKRKIAHKSPKRKINHSAVHKHKFYQVMVAIRKAGSIKQHVLNTNVVALRPAAIQSLPNHRHQHPSPPGGPVEGTVKHRKGRRLKNNVLKVNLDVFQSL